MAKLLKQQEQCQTEVRRQKAMLEESQHRQNMGQAKAEHEAEKRLEKHLRAVSDVKE